MKPATLAPNAKRKTLGDAEQRCRGEHKSSEREDRRGRKTLEPEPSPLSVRKTAGGYEDFTRCRVEPIRARELKKRQRKRKKN
jgi:hypothetical protein